jgi:hypothetical protein
VVAGKDGITNYLRQQAVENPGPFMSLLARILPSQIAAEASGDGSPLVVEIMRFHHTDGGVTSDSREALSSPMRLLNPPTE